MQYPGRIIKAGESDQYVMKALKQRLKWLRFLRQDVKQ